MFKNSRFVSVLTTVSSWGREVANDRYSKLLIFMFFVFALVFTLSLVQVLRIIESNVLSEASDHLAEMSETFAEHVFRTFDSADQALGYVRSQYEDWGYTGGVKTYANLGTASSKLFKESLNKSSDQRCCTL